MDKMREVKKTGFPHSFPIVSTSRITLTSLWNILYATIYFYYVTCAKKGGNCSHSFKEVKLTPFIVYKTTQRRDWMLSCGVPAQKKGRR